MVADTDNGGPNEDEYLPEVNADDSDVKDEYSPETSILHQDYEPEVSDLSPEGPSLFKKVMTILGLVLIAIVVSMYLTYRQKSSEATQTEAPKTTEAAVAKPDDLAAKLGVKTPAPQPAESKPSAASVPAPVKPAMPLVSEISKESASAPISVSPLAAAISENTSPAANNLAASSEKKEVPKAEAKEEPKVEAKADVREETKAEAKEEHKVEATAEPKSESSTPVATVTEVVPVVPVVPVVSEKPAVVVVSPEVKESMAQVNTLATQSNSNQAKIDDLAMRLNGVDQSIVAINKSVDTILKKLSVLETKPAAKVVVSTTKKPVAVATETTLVLPSESSMPYVVRAIVPGRAWIERPLAGVITVMEGDEVPGYGKVAKIDDESGEVTLESGEVIQYGLDDR